MDETNENTDIKIGAFADGTPCRLLPHSVEMSISEAIRFLIQLRDNSAIHNGDDKVTLHVAGDYIKVPLESERNHESERTPEPKRTAETERKPGTERNHEPERKPESERNHESERTPELKRTAEPERKPGTERNHEPERRTERRRECTPGGAASGNSMSAAANRTRPLDLDWKAQRERAIAIGNGDDKHFIELVELLKSPSYEVRRLTASAMKKLLGVDPMLAGLFTHPIVETLKTEAHHQTQQYLLSALKAASRGVDLETRAYLEDIARDTTLKPYLREAANGALATAQGYGRLKESLLRHWCFRCKRPITKEESAVSIEKYGKPYCRHCLDERILGDQVFDRDVEAAKTRRTKDGTAVQSRGEMRIANVLADLGIEYEYDERYRIAEGTSIRPDFYLREFDVYIEYWGMSTPEYLANRAKKLELYQRAGKRLISLSYEDDADLEHRLREKLRTVLGLRNIQNNQQRNEP